MLKKFIAKCTCACMCAFIVIFSHLFDIKVYLQYQRGACLEQSDLLTRIEYDRYAIVCVSGAIFIHPLS